MRVDSKVRLVSNICVNVFLLTFYVYFFGQHSVSKYFDKAVITTSKDEKSSFITPPGEHKYLSVVLNSEWCTQTI